MYKTLYLKKGKDASVRRYHPWIFSGAILKMDEGIAEGDVVDVVGYNGEFIGKGHYQIGSIAVRMLTFSEEEIDEAFWQKRLLSALQMRIAVGVADN